VGSPATFITTLWAAIADRWPALSPSSSVFIRLVFILGSGVERGHDSYDCPVALGGIGQTGGPGSDARAPSI
jgi:hypothetical protein